MTQMTRIHPSVADRIAGMLLHSGRGKSLPFPTRTNATNTYSFFFYREHLLHDEVGAPDFIVSLDAAAGKIVQEEPVALATFGLTLPIIDRLNPMAPVGRKSGATISYEAWLPRLNRLFDDMHALADPFWAGQALSDIGRARNVIESWPPMPESGLMSVYLALGKEWFTWLQSSTDIVPLTGLR